MDILSAVNHVRHGLRRKQFYKNLVLQNNILDETTYIGDESRVADTRWGKHSGCGLRCDVFSAYVGSFTSIAADVKIGSRNHIYENFTTHDICYQNHEEVVRQPFRIPGFRDGYFVEIGNDVWIGSNAFVMRNVDIGDGAVIAAGSVVTKSVPAYAVVAGNPARFVKWRFEPDVIARLKEIKWWEMEDEEIIRRAGEFAQLAGFSLTEYMEQVYRKKPVLKTGKIPGGGMKQIW